MPLTAAEIWRDFNVGSSGTPHKPIKADIRAWGAAVETIGFTIPGAALVPLFSAGVGVAPVFRAIVGFDLPNPSTTTPGAVFSKPVVPGQILSGLGGDGSFTVASVTGTGSIVLSESPSFTGPIRFGTLNFADFIGGTMIVYGPDNRLAFQAAGSVNFYKAESHDIYNSGGTDLFARLNANQLLLQPSSITAATPVVTDYPLDIQTTWNTTGVCVGINLKIVNTASSAASRAFRIMSGSAGTTEQFSVFSDPNNPVIALRGIAILSSPPGSPNFIYASPAGLNYINASGGAFLTTQSNTGVWAFVGTTSGTHTLASQAIASGASTLPNTTGELWNTGLGVPITLQSVAVDFNAANTDHAITIALPTGFTRYVLSSVRVTNTGTTASLTTATGALFTSAAGAGTALVASGTALSALTSNVAGTAGSHAVLTVANTTTYQTDITLFWRTQTAQGAAASGYVSIQVIPIS